MTQRFTITDSNGALAVCGLESIPTEVILAPRPAPDVQWSVETWQPLRGAGQAIGRGGALAKFEWTVARTHATIAAAQIFIRDHPATLPQLGFCTLEWELNGTLAKSTGALSGLTWQRGSMPGVRSVGTYQWTGTLFVPGSVGGN